MSTLKSLAVVGAVFVLVLVVAAVLSLVNRGSPDTPDSQPQAAATDAAPAPEVSPTASAAAELPPETPAPLEQAAGTVAPGASPSRPDREYTIVEILPKNFIPAIRFPHFYDADEAEAVYDEQELVIGLSIGGEHRAYSVPYLSGREIVNDTVGGIKVAVTW